MEYSSMFARVLGAWSIIIATGVLFNLKFYQKTLEDFSRNNAIVYVWGVLSLAFGVFVITFHNIWSIDWRLLVTLLGWAGFVKGVSILVFPESYLKLVNKIRTHNTYVAVHATVFLTIGLILIAAGYSY